MVEAIWNGNVSSWYRTKHPYVFTRVLKLHFNICLLLLLWILPVAHLTFFVTTKGVVQENYTLNTFKRVSCLHMSVNKEWLFNFVSLLPCCIILYYQLWLKDLRWIMFAFLTNAFFKKNTIFFNFIFFFHNLVLPMIRWRRQGLPSKKFHHSSIKHIANEHWEK